MANVRVDDSIHQKIKELAIKNKNKSITKEYEIALKKYIQSESQEQVLIDSGIEILINKKLDSIDKHLASYIGKLDKNIYNLLAADVLLIKSTSPELYEKYKESQIIEYLKYKGEIIRKEDFKDK